MAFLWRITFASFIFCVIVSKYEAEASTRWQPSIIWNRFNPLLTCKCNWMNTTLTKMAIYDRVELLCPKLYLVSTFRKDDMAKREVYYNIFSRKYNYSKDPNLNNLTKMLDNGRFCDTTHHETKKLYTCRRDDINNKKLYNSYRLRFHSDEDLNAGEIVVFFSNKKTGLESDLASTEKNCAMVLVVNITKDPEKRYDPTFDKCVKEGDNCDDINRSPFPCEFPSTEVTTTADPTSNTPTGSSTATTSAPSTDRISTTKGSEPPTTVLSPSYYPREPTTPPPKLCKFRDGIVVGFFIGIGISILFTLVVFVCKKKGPCKRGKESREPGAEMASGKKLEAMVTITASINSESKAINTNDENDVKKDGKLSNGFPNKGFEPSAPAAPPQEESDYVTSDTTSLCNGTSLSVDGGEHAYETPNNPRSRNGRLPSVDGERDRNAENKNHAYEIVART